MRERTAQVLRQAAPHPSFAAQMPPSPKGKAFLRVNCGKLAASAPAARSEAERAEREVSQIRRPPRLFSARSMRLQGLSATRARRRDDGASEPGQTDSHDPRFCQTLRRKRKVWHPAPFLLDRARPVFFSARRKENRGCIPQETPGVPPGPPGKTPDESRRQTRPLIRLASGQPPSPKGEGFQALGLGSWQINASTLSP